MGSSSGKVGQGLSGSPDSRINDPLDIFSGRGAAAASAAAKAMRKAAIQSGQEYDKAYTDVSGQYSPYTGLGSQSAGMLQSGTSSYNSPLLRSFGMSDFQTDPGYQFRLQQGLNALQGSAAAKGGLLSGATMKGINEYGQNFASNEYQNAYDRYNQNQKNQFDRLFGITQMGQQATGNLANLRYATAEGKANSWTGVGQAKASGFLGVNQANQQGINSGVQLGSSIASMF